MLTLLASLVQASVFAKRWRAVVGGLAILLMGLAGWFLAVDYSTSFESCSRCFDHRFIGEYRVLGIPVSTTHGHWHVNNAS